MADEKKHIYKSLCILPRQIILGPIACVKNGFKDVDLKLHWN